MNSLRGLARQSLFRLAKFCGANARLGRSSWRNSRLLILCYHGVSLANEHEWSPWLFVREETLRSRLVQLRRLGASILPLHDALSRMRAGTLPPLATAITFDDGFSDFSRLAVPLLREFDAPATLYLTTWYCGKSEPVFDPMVDFLLWRARHKRTVDVMGIVPGVDELRVGSEDERRTTWQQVHRAVSAATLSGGEKIQLLRKLGHRLDHEFQALLDLRVLHLMTPAEVRALPLELIDIELHTHRHRTPRDRRLFEAEVTDNREGISRIVCDRVERRQFCYPSGVTAPEFLPWLRGLGVTSATTCDAGLASKDDDPLLLPRVLDSEVMSGLEFETWVCGTRSWLTR